MAVKELPWDQEIYIKSILPDLSAVARLLFVDSNPRRPSVEDYADSLAKRGRLTPAVSEAIQKAEGIKNNTRTIVYIAGPLTGVDEITKARYELVSDLLEKYNRPNNDRGKKTFFGYVPHLHGTDPIKHPDVTSDEVRDTDNLWATVVADMQVNFLQPVAHGNAIEEGWAEKVMIPAVYLTPFDYRLSRLTLGMNNVARFINYTDFTKDGLNQLRIFFDEFSTWLSYFPRRDPRAFFYLSPKVLREPVLREYGLDPAEFNQIFSCYQFLLYVKNPSHPRYGQVGELGVHRSDEGNLVVEFSDKSEIAPDTTQDFSWWIK